MARGTATGSRKGKQPTKERVPNAPSAKAAPRRRLRTDILIPRYATATAKRVWLTLDDGPHPTHTVKVLGALAQHGVRATFFVTGTNAANHGSLIQQAVAAGHSIGNHTYSHPDLTKLTATEIRSEIEKTDKLIKAYAGSDKMFRPPYGAYNKTVSDIAAEFGYRIVLWNVDTLDWDSKYQPDKWIQHGVDQIRARDNSTVLAHDIHKTTADNFATFIQRIKDIGNVSFEAPKSAVVAV